MILAHYTTALIAHNKDKRIPFALLLILSQLPDLLWFVLHYFGIGNTQPISVFETALPALTADFTYHHDLLPVFVYSIILVLAGKLFLGRWKSGIILGILVFVHLIFDLIAGYEHFIFGTDSHAVGTGMYVSSPALAMTIDLIIALGLTFMFIKMEKSKGNVFSSRKKNYLYAIVIIGTLFWFPTAFGTLNELLGTSINIGFNTLMPTLIFFEAACIYLFYRVVIKMK